MTTTTPDTTTGPAISDRGLFDILDRADFAGLSTTALRFLLLVKLTTPEVPSDNPTAIASRLLVSTSTASGLGKELQRLKLVTRGRNKEDDRKVTYKLTQKGTDYLHTIRTGENHDVIA